MGRLIVAILLTITIPAYAESPVKTPLALTSITQMLLALIIVVGLILLCAWLFKRLNGFSHLHNAPIKILSSTALGTRERLLLVAVGKEQILIGVCPGRIQTLHVLKDNVQIAEPRVAPIAGSFQNRLLEALQARRSVDEPAGGAS